MLRNHRSGTPLHGRNNERAAERAERRASTSAHHLIARIGEEQGYRLAESSGMDIEDSITIATRLLKGRIAKQVWRDYHKHAFARRAASHT